MWTLNTIRAVLEEVLEYKGRNVGGKGAIIGNRASRFRRTSE